LGMKDAPRITFSWITNSHIKTYSIEKTKFALNSAWNEDLLHQELFRPKTTEFETYPLLFDLKENAEIMVYRQIDLPNMTSRLPMTSR